MIDLVLINPNARKKIYQGLGASLTAVEPPLWCRLLAGHARDHGFTTVIIDAEAEEMSKEQVVDRIIELEPRLITLVAFGHQPSASTQQMVGVRDILDELTYMQITTPSIIVGGHASALPERTLLEENCNYVCKGEGPITILGLLEGRPVNEIPGLVWQKHVPKGIAINPPAPLIIDLDNELFDGAWDLLPMSRYRPHNWQLFGWGNDHKHTPYASIYTSLGCPYKCNFCCINAPFDSNRYRMRSGDSVAREIAYLYDRYQVRVFKIIDEMFVLNDRHVTDVCQSIIDQNFENGINIWAYARVDTIKNQEQLKLMRRAGVNWLALGIESGSEHVRDGAEKHFGNGDIIEVVRAIQDTGINVIGNYIFGLPDDTMESMNATLDLAKGLNCEFANFYAAMAYPGSKLYKDAVVNGARLPQRWSGYSQHSYDCLPMATATLSSEEVLQFRDEAFREYFSREEYLRMLSKKFGNGAIRQVEAMLKVPLRREILGT